MAATMPVMASHAAVRAAAGRPDASMTAWDRASWVPSHTPIPAQSGPRKTETKPAW